MQGHYLHARSSFSSLIYYSSCETESTFCPSAKKCGPKNKIRHRVSWLSYPKGRLKECGSRSLHRDLQFSNPHGVHLPEVGRAFEVFHCQKSLVAAHTADYWSAMLHV